MDKITLERIELMHPDYRKELKDQYLAINAKLPRGVRLRLSHTLRTNDEQNALFAMGRTASGSIVTNSKGGQSIHNFALAFDIVILLDTDNNNTFETAIYSGKHFMRVVNYFKAQGWEWGGDWKHFKDMPHFQAKKSDGTSYKWRELSALPKDKNNYLII